MPFHEQTDQRHQSVPFRQVDQATSLIKPYPLTPAP